MLRLLDVLLFFLMMFIIPPLFVFENLPKRPVRVFTENIQYYQIYEFIFGIISFLLYHHIYFL